MTLCLQSLPILSVIEVNIILSVSYRLSEADLPLKCRKKVLH